LKAPKDENEYRSVIKIFNENINDNYFKAEILQEHPDIKTIVSRFS